MAAQTQVRVQSAGKVAISVLQGCLLEKHTKLTEVDMITTMSEL